MDSTQLTRGQRQFLARKGITGREWDNLTPQAQSEWLDEMKCPYYEKNDYEQGTARKQFSY